MTSRMASQPGEAPRYRVCLFVAGQEPNSAQALASLERICQERLRSACELQIVDVLENPEAALARSIVAAPALIVESPPPRRVIVGSLADEARLLAALGPAEDRSSVSDQELPAQLEHAEALVTALRRGEIDALLGESGPLLLRPKSLVDERARLRTEAEWLARQWQATFDAVPDAIWLLDEEQRVVRANRAAAETFQCPLEEIIGSHCYPFVHGTTAPIPDCPFCRMRHTLRRESLEMQTGGRWFFVTADPILDAEGNLTGAVHIATDVTERKQAEEKIRESEESYRNLFQNAQVGLFRTRISDGKILESNDQLARMFGYDSREEFIAEYATAQNYVDPGTRERMLRELWEKGTVQNFQARFYRKDGSIFWVQYSARIYPEKGWIEGVAEDITERKRAEEALRESEARYRDLVENTHDLICTHDLEGRILSVNRAAVELTGYSTEELIGKNLRDILAPDVRHGLENYLAEIQQKGMASGLMKVETKSGETRLWEYRNSLRTEGVATPIVRGFARDVTEQKRAERALRESEARNRYISETISDYAYSFQVAPDGTMRGDWVNDAFIRTFGFTPDEIEARGGWQTMVYPDDLPMVIAHAQRVVHGQKDVCEMRFVTRHGEVRWLRDYAIPVWDPKENRVVRIYGAAQDITERKRAEEALRESERRYATLVEASPVGIFRTDAQGQTTYVSRRWCQIAGLEAEAALGDGWLAAVHPDDRDRLASGWTEAAQAGRASTAEYRFLHADGTIRWVAGQAVPERDERGRVTGYVGVITDITEHKQVEEERLRLQEQLYHAQRMESVGRLAGGIAHDFNNILSVILGYGEVGLRKVHPRDPLAVNFQQIVEAARRASALTGQLLAFSRKQTLQPRVLNLNTVVQNLEEMLERLIGEDIALHLHLDPELALVEVDPGQMEQVIMNLVVNARDAMPQGGQLIIETRNVVLDEVYARTHPEAMPGPHVLLAVTDTGCGIEPDLLDKIFEPFFTTKEKGQGTGLGLSTVYGIVRQSGGTIWVYSERGQGTTFKIYLPQTRGAPPVTKEELRPEREPAALGQQVLVVEDEPAVRELLEQILASAGYRVTAVANSGEALLWVEEKGLRPDLLLVDVILPGMDGSALAARLRHSLPDLKVLYMSGYTDNVIAHRGVLDPGTHFIQKPFTLDDLTQKVQEVLRSP